jgi:hypothetical protein
VAIARPTPNENRPQAALRFEQRKSSSVSLKPRYAHPGWAVAVAGMLLRKSTAEELSRAGCPGGRVVGDRPLPWWKSWALELSRVGCPWWRVEVGSGDVRLPGLVRFHRSERSGSR